MFWPAGAEGGSAALGRICMCFRAYGTFAASRSFGGRVSEITRTTKGMYTLVSPASWDHLLCAQGKPLLYCITY